MYIMTYYIIILYYISISVSIRSHVDWWTNITVSTFRCFFFFPSFLTFYNLLIYLHLNLSNSFSNLDWILLYSTFTSFFYDDYLFNIFYNSLFLTFYYYFLLVSTLVSYVLISFLCFYTNYFYRLLIFYSLLDWYFSFYSLYSSLYFYWI